MRLPYQHIREAAVFVHALSSASLSSEACRSERQYAERLNIPIIPVQVGTINNPRSRQELLQHMVDYRKRDARRAVLLMAAIRSGEERRSRLPEPLPVTPDLPFSYLRRLHADIESKVLPFDDQRRICWELQDYLRGENDNGAKLEIRELLRDLRRRTDLVAILAQYIDTILASD